MTPMTYIVKQGAATLAELSGLMRSDKAGAETLRRWAREEMEFLGIAVTIS